MAHQASIHPLGLGQLRQLVRPEVLGPAGCGRFQFNLEADRHPLRAFRQGLVGKDAEVPGDLLGHGRFADRVVEGHAPAAERLDAAEGKAARPQHATCCRVRVAKG